MSAANFFDFSDKEVMLPQIKEINGMYYRFHPVTEAKDVEKESASRARNVTSLAESEADLSSEERDILRRLRKDPKDNTYRIVLTKENIPSILFPMMIGKGGQAKRSIEDETKARIVFPRDQEKNTSIEIYSYDSIQLIMCRRKLLQSAHNARMRVPFTHFACFPVLSDATAASFNRFRDDVMKKCGGTRGLSTDLFQTSNKLHLTISTLALFSPPEYDLAFETLQNCFADELWELLDQGPLRCRLRGLEIMNDDPAEVDVLYAKVVDPTDRLQTIADQIYENYMHSEPRFSQDKFDGLKHVKLHVTLINSRYRKGTELGEDDLDLLSVAAKATARKTFDASSILQHFGQYDFGECVVNEIHISQRFSTGENGFYKCKRKLILDPKALKNHLQQRDATSTVKISSDRMYNDEPTCEVGNDDEFADER
ncbi:hypothetical protein RvY_14681 [Ramazzottius varieornatus]|uniref:K Homology domain-containing protein n=1 Tax=Ramazzottius varieornatus TaxID=947166 RepID=A0A1D1VS53_RAMVA|nr:hypothetical protein RvY_14681 [Ramazzottius varieornatus]